MEKIAIIGMGISGMGVLLAYDKLDQKHEIHCFDQKTSFGRGYPFRTDAKDVLLNVRPDYVSFDHEKPTAFVEWLKARNYAYDEYVPRHIFGEFLQERAEELISTMGAVAIKEDVSRLSYIKEDQCFLVETIGGHQDTFDRVHLCCGELPPKDFYDLQGDKNYLGTIYPLHHRLREIKPSESVGVIGTSLSAIDVTRYLLYNDKAKEVVMFSRNNVFPTVRLRKLNLKAKFFTADAIMTIRGQNNGFIDYQEVEDLLQKEWEHHDIDTEYLLSTYDVGFDAITKSLEGDDQVERIQSLYADLIGGYNASWFGMNHLDKKTFEERQQPLIQIFGAPTPIETGEILKEMMGNGRLQVVEDAITVKKDKDTGLFHIVKETDKTHRIAAKLHWMVNATGLDNSFESIKSTSLLAQLRNDEIIQISPCGGVVVLEDTFKVVSPRYGVIDGLHAHGVLIAGVQLINNDTEAIKRSAAEVIRKIYK